MKLAVRVPKSLGLRQIIVGKYTNLYREYRRFYPERKEYTYKQLRKNIAEVAAIVHEEVELEDIRRSTFIPWLDRDWRQLYYKHWYFALTIEQIGDKYVAIVRDAHYEGDHHNDTLLTKPYDIDDLKG